MAILIYGKDATYNMDFIFPAPSLAAAPVVGLKIEPYLFLLDTILIYLFYRFID